MGLTEGILLLRSKIIYNRSINPGENKCDSNQNYFHFIDIDTTEERQLYNYVALVVCKESMTCMLFSMHVNGLM